MTHQSDTYVFLSRAFALSEKPVTMVGINFNVKEERNITEWVIK